MRNRTRLFSIPMCASSDERYWASVADDGSALVVDADAATVSAQRVGRISPAPDGLEFAGSGHLMLHLSDDGATLRATDEFEGVLWKARIDEPWGREWQSPSPCVGRFTVSADAVFYACERRGRTMSQPAELFRVPRDDAASTPPVSVRLGAYAQILDLEAHEDGAVACLWTTEGKTLHHALFGGSMVEEQRQAFELSDELTSGRLTSGRTGLLRGDGVWLFDFDVNVDVDVDVGELTVQRFSLSEGRRSNVWRMPAASPDAVSLGVDDAGVGFAWCNGNDKHASLVAFEPERDALREVARFGRAECMLIGRRARRGMVLGLDPHVFELPSLRRIVELDPERAQVSRIRRRGLKRVHEPLRQQRVIEAWSVHDVEARRAAVIEACRDTEDEVLSTLSRLSGIEAPRHGHGEHTAPILDAAFFELERYGLRVVVKDARLTLASRDPAFELPDTVLEMPWLAQVGGICLRGDELGFGEGLFDERAAALARRVEMVGLRRLELHGTGLSPHGASALCAGPWAGTVLELVLTWEAVKSAGAAAIAAGFQNLRVLSLDFTADPSSPADFCAALGMGAFSSLVQLGLNNNGIDARALSHILEVPWASQLRVLSLAGTREVGNAIGDEGAALLSNARLVRLQHLDLRGNDIGAHGARALVESTALPKDLSLDLRNNMVPDDLLAALEMRYPQVRV
ncbi:MAG: hypothetical protein IPK13_27270 [Deltaproteobacteria bacterium]|nr:hypothetical protein [Deltaproteobacteria bacterium]